MLADAKLQDEVGRLAALRRYDILDTGSEDDFEKIVALVQRIFDVPMAAVTFIDSDRQWFKARRGLDASETPRSGGFCDHTIASFDGLMVEDAERDPRFADSPLVTGAPHIRSYLGAPLRTPDGYQVGALCVIGHESRRFTTEEREILRRFSEIVVSQMELRQLASRDSLTGARTRRAFDHAVFEALEAYRKDSVGAALAIIDIDHFKRINDLHGHGCGDAVLVAVTAALLDAVGPHGVIGRLGGEEFGVLIESADAAVVAMLVERLRAAVAAVTLPARQIRVTASIGVACLESHICTAEVWMHAADMALYAAKAAGRDRVEMARRL
jgi:diguanylate cyclase (GGDEF)-like protein